MRMTALRTMLGAAMALFSRRQDRQNQTKTTTPRPAAGKGAGYWPKQRPTFRGLSGSHPFILGASPDKMRRNGRRRARAAGFAGRLEGGA